MIYYELISGTNTVAFTHYKPFDEIHGFGKTRSELEQTGFFVDAVPDPELIQGKNSVLKVDLKTMELYYDYVERPITAEEKIEQLESDLGNVLLESAADKARISELEMTQGDLLMEIALLKGHIR